MSSRNRPRPREAGFTLIEILLAITILGMVAAIVSVSFATTMRLRDRALDDVGREHLARSTLTLIADELMVSRVHRKFRWFGRNGEEEGRPADLLSFTTSAQYRVQPNVAEADVAHIVYVRKKDRLFRYSMRNPYAINDSAVDRTEIADGVTAFNVRYFNKRLSVWLDQWDEGTSAMPAGILIELTLANPSQAPRTYTAWIPTAPLLTSPTTPTGAGIVPKQ